MVALDTDSTTVTVDVGSGGAVATLTLNRPDKRNALSAELLRAYIAHLANLSETPGVKVIVTRAAGPTFCAGMDLHELGEVARAWDETKRPWSDGGLLADAIHTIRLHPAILIAQVHGYCAGGGLAIVAAHDLAVAATSSRFILPETERGSFGAVAAAAMHRKVPAKIAFDVQLTDRELSGGEAAAYGLVSRAVEDADLEHVTRQMAMTIGGKHFAPVTHAKMAAFTSEQMTFEQTIMNDLLVGAKQNHIIRHLDNVDEFLANRKRPQNEGAR